MKILLELTILLPLCGSLLLVMAGGRLPRRLVESVACGVIWGSFAATIGAAVNYTGPINLEIVGWLADFDLSAPIRLYLDPLSLTIIVMVTFVCGLIHLYAVAYMAEDPGYVRFFALMNLFVASMLLLLLAENLPLLYMGWEGVGFCSYGLIGFWYREEKNATAARKAFIVTRIGDVALGIAIVWLFQLTTTVSIPQINGLASRLEPAALTTLGLLLLAGATGKSAQLPLSVWLPDAMAGPTPVSALIHAATMVTAGVYLLMRFFPLIGLSSTVMAAIAVTGALSAFYAASCATVQRDLKRVLAYSTISQIGFMVLGVGAGAVSAATFHLLVHAFFKALLFLGAGCVITIMHHEQDIFRMGGLRKSQPVLYGLFLTGALCLAGFPLTGGFFSKDGILEAVWAAGGALYGTLFMLGLITAFMTAFYTFRMVWLVFGGEGRPSPSKPGGHAEALPALMKYTLFPLAFLGLCGGIINLPAWLGNGWLDSFLAPASPVPPHIEHLQELVLQVVAGLTAIGGIMLAWWRYGTTRSSTALADGSGPLQGLNSFLFHGWYLDRLYELLFVTPFKNLAGLLWIRVDEGVIDRFLDGLARMLGQCGIMLGRCTNGRVSNYLLSLAAGAALLAAWLVWGSL